MNALQDLGCSGSLPPNLLDVPNLLDAPASARNERNVPNLSESGYYMNLNSSMGPPNLDGFAN